MFSFTQLRAQYPLWASGADKIDFKDGLTVSGLPQPAPISGHPAHYFYNGWLPEYHSHIQFDQNGELLFFILDGVIFNGKGYMIADAHHRGNNQTYAWPKIGTRPDIGVTSRPGRCMQFFIFYDFETAGQPFADTDWACLLVDMAETSDLYSGNSINGRLIEPLFSNDVGFFHDGLTTFNDIDHPTLINGENDGDYGLIFNRSPFGGNKETFTHFEVIETADNGNKMVMAGVHEELVTWVLEEDGILSWAGYGNGNYSVSFKTANGELESARNPYSGNYSVASANPSGANAEINVFIFNFNTSFQLVGSPVTIAIPVGESGGQTLFGLEFSADAKYLYFLREHPSTALGYIDMFDYSVHIVTSISVPMSFARSRMELNVLPDGETPVIYVYGTNTLGAIGNTNDPANLTWTPDVLDANDLNAITIYPASGNIPAFRNMQNQNLNGMQMQDYLQRAECCEEVSRPASPINTTVTTANHGTWTNGNNGLGNLVSPVIFTENLVFNTGTATTINGMTFEFAPTAHMIIRQGASVTINGTTLTNLHCDSKMWPGVDVLGTPTQAQTVAQGQGQLRMLNSSLIEHAYNAIEVGNLPSNGGGIIRVDNSTIRNCQNGIRWKPYVWFSGGNPVTNAALITNLTVIVDDELLDESIYPGQMAHLERVNLIRFVNSSFINSTDEETYGYGERGTGIFNWQSSFTCDGLNESYDGPQDNLHTAFHGLSTGIFSYGWGVSWATYRCRMMEFEHNYSGIVNFATNHPKVTFNNFFIPEQWENIPYEPRGAMFVNSTGYEVQENFFYGDPAGEKTAIGCWINNSGEHSDLVRRNTFDRLLIGSLTELINALPASQTGLQWLCNMYTKNVTDIERGTYSTMRHDQGGNQGFGNPAVAAGNQFSETVGCIGGYADFKISTTNTWWTNYHHHGDAHSIPDCEWVSTIDQTDLLFPISFTPGDWSPEDCPTDYPEFSGLMAGRSMEDLLDELSEAETARDAFVADYESIINQGNTGELLTVLNSTYPQESAYVRNLLLANYPLSREVLRTTLERAEIMDSWHLTQVLVANSPLDPDLLRFLDEYEILSAYFMTYVDAAQQGGAWTALRNLLNAQMAGHQTGYARLRNLIAQKILLPEFDPEDEEAEPVVIDHALLASLWAGEDSPMAVRLAADAAGAAGNYTEAISLLTPYASDPWLGGLSEFVALEAEVNGDWAQADEARQDALFAMWQDEANPARHSALAVLHLLGLTDELPTYEGGPTLKSTKQKKVRERNQAIELTVFPTNATSEIFVGYPAEADGMGRLLVYAADGRLMDEIKLSHNGYLAIDISRWAQGLYLVTLHNGNQVVATTKFNVLK